MKPKDVAQLMGAVVTVHTELVRHQRDRWLKLWERCELLHPRSGWIVGHVIKYDGRTIYHGYDEGYGWQQHRGIPCLLVCYWPNMRPVCVPFDGYTMGGTPAPTQRRK